MYKTVFASITGESSGRAVLDASLILSSLFEASVDCVHVRLDRDTMNSLMKARPFTTQILVDEQVRVLEREAREQAEHGRAIFDAFCKAHSLETENGSKNGAFRWQQVNGIDTDETIALSRIYDIVVLGRDPETYSLGRERIAAIVMACGRPVLLVPERSPKSLSGTVILAWKDRAEAARAAAVAQPMLTRATRVIVAHALEGKKESRTENSIQRLAMHLERHGCHAEARSLPDNGSSAADRLRALASELDADLLVMGSYGHSRLSEFVFGSLTSEILRICAIPVLLFH